MVDQDSAGREMAIVVSPSNEFQNIFESVCYFGLREVLFMVHARSERQHLFQCCLLFFIDKSRPEGEESDDHWVIMSVEYIGVGGLFVAIDLVGLRVLEEDFLMLELVESEGVLVFDWHHWEYINYIVSPSRLNYILRKAYILVLIQSPMSTLNSGHFNNTLNSGHRKNSALVRQLCEHVARLEQANITFQEQIIKMEAEQEHLCHLYSSPNWSHLYSVLVSQAKSDPCQEKTRLVQAKGNSAMERLLHRDESQVLSDSCYDEESALNTPIHALSDMSQQSHPTASVFYGGEQSPIRSESNLMSRSIRGDTDRESQRFQQSEPQGYTCPDNEWDKNGRNSEQFQESVPRPALALVNGWNKSQHNHKGWVKEQSYHNLQNIDEYVGWAKDDKVQNRVNDQYSSMPSFSDCFTDKFQIFKAVEMINGNQQPFNSSMNMGRRSLKEHPDYMTYKTNKHENNWEDTRESNWGEREEADREEENALLSMENTKLRQRVAKLEAIVHSRNYT